MKVTFINEMADLCEKAGADVHDVARGIGLDGRIGRKFLHPGPGFGGSCFPKDTLALMRIAQDAGAPTRLVETDRRGERRAQGRHGDAGDRGLRRLGARQDDRRARPDLQAGNRRHARLARRCRIVSRLVEDGATMRAFDPEGMEQARPLLPARWSYCRDALDAAAGADALVLITEWNEFRALAPGAAARRPCAGGCWSICATSTTRWRCAQAGFDYHGIGRPDIGSTGRASPAR